MLPAQWIFIMMMVCVLLLALLEIGSRVRVWWRTRLRYMSSSAQPLPPDVPIAAPQLPAQPPPPATANAIATPHNDHNALVVRCEHITKLAVESGDDPARVEAVIIVLARLIITAKRADGTAKIGETDAIRCGLDIKPGGSNPRYALARAALQAELGRQRGEKPPRDEIDEVTPTGEVIRRDAMGERYMLDETRQRLPV